MGGEQLLKVYHNFFTYRNTKKPSEVTKIWCERCRRSLSALFGACPNLTISPLVSTMQFPLKCFLALVRSGRVESGVPPFALIWLLSVEDICAVLVIIPFVVISVHFRLSGCLVSACLPASCTCALMPCLAGSPRCCCCCSNQRVTTLRPDGTPYFP